MIWTYFKYLAALIFAVGMIMIVEGAYIIGLIIISSDFLLLAISCICDYLFKILNNFRDLNQNLNKILQQKIHEQTKNEEN